MKLTNSTNQVQNAQQIFAKAKLAQTKSLEPVVAKTVESPTPSETFTPSTLPRAKTLADPQEVKVETPVVKEKPLAKPREGSDMAQMLEDIEHAQKAGGLVHSNPNGVLTVFHDIAIEDAQLGETLAHDPDLQHLTPVDDSHAKSHGKHHHMSDNMKHAHLGGHLGTEVVEKLGHAAHEGMEAVSTAGAKVASHSVHGMSGVGDLAALKDDVSDSMLDVADNVVSKTTQSAAQEAAHHVTGEATHHVGGEVTKQATEAAHQAGGHAAEAAHHLSTGLTTALAGASALSGGIGGVMLYTGGKELAHGIKSKDGEMIAEGVGDLALGARSVAAATVMANLATTGSSTLATVAGVAAQTLTPLGVIHGAIDVGLGVKDIVQGKDKVGGALKMGFGGAVIAGAIVGGLPLTITALAALGAKVTYGVIKAKKAKKAAQLQQQQQAAANPVTPETEQQTKAS